VTESSEDSRSCNKTMKNSACLTCQRFNNVTGSHNMYHWIITKKICLKNINWHATASLWTSELTCLIIAFVPLPLSNKLTHSQQLVRRFTYSRVVKYYSKLWWTNVWSFSRAMWHSSSSTCIDKRQSRVNTTVPLPHVSTQSQYNCVHTTHIDTSPYNWAHTTCIDMSQYYCALTTCIDTSPYNCALTTCIDTSQNNCAHSTSIDTSQYYCAFSTCIDMSQYYCALTTCIDTSPYNCALTTWGKVKKYENLTRAQVC